MAIEISGTRLLVLDRTEDRTWLPPLELSVPTLGFGISIAAGDRRVAFFDLATASAAVLDEQLRPSKRFPSQVFSALGGLALRGDTLVGIGHAVFTTEPISMEQAKDAAFRAGHSRPECFLFTTRLGRSGFQVEPLACDASLRDGREVLLSRGALAFTENGNLAAALSGSDLVWFFDQDLRHLATTSYLEPGERLALPSEQELAICRRGGVAASETALRVFDRMDLIQGMVVGNGVVGLLFRRRVGDRSVFVMDLFSEAGSKLADDLPVPFPPLHHGVRALTVHTAGDGNFALLQHLEPGEVVSQRLYRLAIEPAHDAPAR